MPYPNEYSCRLVEPSQVRVVGSGYRTSGGKRYRVIFAIPKSGGGSIEQAYRYPKDTWSADQARSHCQSHEGRFDAAAKDTSIEFYFLAGVHSLFEADGQREATLYLMNTSRNRNHWGVTDKALTEALPTLKGKPLGCGPNYKIDDHYKDPLDVGKFVSSQKPNGYAMGTAHIEDETAWQKLKAKEWGPVSVVIHGFHQTCSRCNAELTSADGGPFEHDCVKKNHGYIVVHSFRFQRVDFVDRGAYPQAGVTDIAASQRPGVITPIELLASFYESQGEFDAYNKTPEDRPWKLDRSAYTLEQLRYASAVVTGDGDKKSDCHLPHHLPGDGRTHGGTVVWHGVDAAGKSLMGSRGGVQLSDADVGKARRHLATHYREFDKDPPWSSQSSSHSGRGAGSPGPNGRETHQGNRRKTTMEPAEELEALKKDFVALEKERDTLKAQVDKLSPLEGKVTALEAQLKAIQDAQHHDLLHAAVEARFDAKLCDDKAKELEALKEYPDAILKRLTLDAQKIAATLKPPTTPRVKAQHTTESLSALETAMNEYREFQGIEKRYAGWSLGAAAPKGDD
jgi:hypothetical protein